MSRSPKGVSKGDLQVNKIDWSKSEQESQKSKEVCRQC